MSELRVGQKLLLDGGGSWNRVMSIITITRVLKKYFECSNGRKYNLDMRERGEGGMWVRRDYISILDDKGLEKLRAFNYARLKQKLTSEVSNCVNDCIKSFGDEFVIELRDFLLSHNPEWFTESEAEFKLENKGE
tara:strand:+ start:2020 stop:2424 length:405 start_codon:yes stop_codon:yes gene_type:complete